MTLHISAATPAGHHKAREYTRGLPCKGRRLEEDHDVKSVGYFMLHRDLGGWGWGCVYIRFCGNGCYWFRPYGELLGKAPSNQALLPLSFGPSLRLRVPSLRSCSVGPPPSAIHGRGRLTRHPCRVAHCAEPALSLSRGRLPPQPPRRPESRPGSFAYAFLSLQRPLIPDMYTDPRVGAGLLAIASVQAINASTDTPLSPASRLLREDWVHTIQNCRSWLASDGRQR